MISLRSIVRTCAAGALSLLGVSQLSAGLNFSIYPVNGNVVMVGSGSVDLAGLAGPGGAEQSPAVRSDWSLIMVGMFDQEVDFYSPVTPPSPALGDSSFRFVADNGWGDSIGLIAIPNLTPGLYVPDNYVSGTSLSGTAIFLNTTVADLGLTPGVYTWTWGSGANADSATLTISVPEPSTWAAIAGLGALGLIALRRRVRA
ncbi:MAG: PEP-CTERM sorting domain-containing protein [Verrucomicrobiota bacterium JB022]|nr:PEP-CTERM sorting domain-containing protein [Verrucomicrobiota bacterium JB022]